MRKIAYTLLCLMLAGGCLWGQTDKREVRAGNRKFDKENYKTAEIDYRKAVVKDSLSVAGNYNLASALYRQQDWEGAGKALEQVKEVAPSGDHAADWHYNSGDVALQKKDYGAAVKAFREALLLHPDDLDAKENYIYAKKMLENRQQQQNQDNQNQNDQNQDNQDQNQDQQDQNQNQDQQDQKDQQDQNQDQDQQDQQDQQQQEQPQEQKISPQQAAQMLKAIQAKEKETQDKVKKEKAAALQSRQKDKNW